MEDKNKCARTCDSTSYPAWIPAQKDDLPEAGEVLDPGCDRRADTSEPPSGQCDGQSREPGRLSAKSLAAWNASQLNNHTRVTAYTFSGQQCCMAGYNNYKDLTFPGTTLVKSLLASDTSWIQMASPEEEAATGKWYTFLPFKPKAIIHCNGSVAFPSEMLQAYGNTITVLEQAHALIPSESSQNDKDDDVDQEWRFLIEEPTPKNTQFELCTD